MMAGVVMDSQLRRAVAHDANWLFAIYRSTMKPNIDAAWGWDEEFQRNAFKQHLPLTDWTVIVQNQQALGGYIVYEKPDHLWLEMIIVAPEFQRRGVADAVMDHLKNTDQSGRIRLSVMKVNPALQFYLQRGFTQYDQDDWSYKLEWTA